MWFQVSWTSCCKLLTLPEEVSEETLPEEVSEEVSTDADILKGSVGKNFEYLYHTCHS